MSTTTDASRGGMRVHVQKFGTFLSNMIMPNIPALIAWGLLTALFIDVGWLPNADLATMVGPTIHYLLPILIAGTGGRMVHGDRGAVVGAFSVMGAIAGSDLIVANFNATLPADAAQLGQVHMFIGAMILGPLSAWVMKRLDALWDGKVRPGFEMLVNMFSAGITAFVMALFGFWVVARVVNEVMDVAGNIVETLVDNSLLPLTSLLIEPAKVFFLNNAINHGVLTPLGISEAAESGKSVLFLLEANPGPGLGLLLAFSVFGKGIAKATAPGAAVIHFLGGIHEIYFPYVLMKPKLILAMIAGGMTGVAINVAFDVGLRAPAAPGSIFAVYAQTASDSYVGVTLAVIGSAAVTFAVASFLLKLDRTGDGDLAAATAQMEANKGKRSSVSGALVGPGATAPGQPIHEIVFACDAGMGSSAMGASVLRRKVHAAGFPDVTVVNKAISSLEDDWDVVVTHRDLTDRARQRAGSAVHVSVDNFMASPRYDEIVEMVREANGGGAGGAAAATPVAADEGAMGAGSVLVDDAIVLSGTARTRDDAISEVGGLLVASGAVEPSYVDAMHERERSVSTHMGNLLAIPHGTNEAKGDIRRTAISFVRYPEMIDWNGKQAEFVVGIAGAGKDHLALLSKLATVFVDDEQVARLRRAQSAEEVRGILEGVRA
ncbi:PTS mannitol transporter subunit IICBA [uncultured Nocardioides sp.]|uniref:Mannitol-specific phosphotransferase enzyme IIA component n=1 Tax=uncultured Nocardioides sp. TaxID=198441 RepID=A0A6J4P9E2_9ACTN|nr:PTS mannitol transporter subunit IICBA [uncultured Nocardioides sp.]CAA9409591.1 MAG: PTS system, mannitol-specific IIC component / PTS system, mannitol-specific IIB component / PTS system, mannitol-specific IIA component [uncultured Nocardioides sp.]